MRFEDELGGGPSFDGTFSVLVKSGGPNATVHLGISTAAGSSFNDEFASASADPFIFVDPGFTGAALYTVSVSPGVANAPAVPEPGAALLLTGGLLALRVLRRRQP